MLQVLGTVLIFAIVIGLVFASTRGRRGWEERPPYPTNPAERVTPAPERVRKLAIGVRTWLPTDDAETLDEMCLALGLDVPPLPPKRLMPANPVRQDDED